MGVFPQYRKHCDVTFFKMISFGPATTIKVTGCAFSFLRNKHQVCDLKSIWYVYELLHIDNNFTHHTHLTLHIFHLCVSLTENYSCHV